MKKGTIISIIVIIVCIVAIGVLIWVQKKSSVTNSQITEGACTQDALLCPDGTGVIRVGKSCTFAPCPNQTAFTGVLIKQKDAYSLKISIVSLSDGSSTQQTYSLPLVLQPGIDVTKNIGQNVVVQGTFKEGNTLQADSVEGVADATPPTHTVALGVGETGSNDGIQITLNKISEDSRCPSDVTCIQAGSVLADVTLKNSTDSKNVSIRSSQNPQIFDGDYVFIATIVPTKKSKVQIKPSDYKITFKVQKI